jgi:hypothetical protein
LHHPLPHPDDVSGRALFFLPPLLLLLLLLLYP